MEFPVAREDITTSTFGAFNYFVLHLQYKTDNFFLDEIANQISTSISQFMLHTMILEWNDTRIYHIICSDAIDNLDILRT